MSRMLPWMLLIPAAALAAPASNFPYQLPHQGRLLDAATGLPLDGSHALAFGLHDAPAGGVALFTETLTVDLDGGFYAVTLGADPTNPLDAPDLAGPRWLSIAVDGGAPLERIAIGSAPWAVHAENARNLSGGSVDATSIKVNGVTVIGETGAVAASWNDLTDVPADLADGDELQSIACADGDLLAWDGGAWTCQALGDLSLDAAVIASGTLDVSRLPVGTSSGQVAAGDHGHTAADVGALPAAGGSLSGALKGTEASFSGLVQVGPSSADCESDTKGAIRWGDDALEVCDGTDWFPVVLAKDDGSTSAGAGTSCRTILARYPSSKSGSYWIDPDGAGAFQAWCNMSDQGGGWTLVARMTKSCMTDSRGAVSTVTGPAQSACAKLSDAKINALRVATGSEGIFWGWQDSSAYAMPATGRFLKIMAGDFNASDYQSGLAQQCSCVPGGPWSSTYNAQSTMAGVYNHSSGAWQCVTSGQTGCTSLHVYGNALFLYQHVLHQPGTFPSNSHGISGGSNGWLYLR